MRKRPIVVLAASLLHAGCAGDPAGPAPEPGPSGVVVTTVSTGADLDPDGYRLVVDGAEGSRARANDTLSLIALDPGTHVIELAGLSSNCAVEGEATRAIDIARGKIANLSFLVACTATTGVIAVTVTETGPDPSPYYWVSLDLGTAGSFRGGRREFIARVPPGNHVLDLLPTPNCSAPDNHKTVTVAAGGLTRDTVDVGFAVVCEELRTKLRVTTRTKGVVPVTDDGEPFRVLLGPLIDTWWWDEDLGHIDPNETREFSVRPRIGEFKLELTPVPDSCEVRRAPSSFSLAHGIDVEVEFTVECW